MPRQSDECFTPGEGTHQRYLRASKGLKFNTIKVVVGNPGRFMGREKEQHCWLQKRMEIYGWATI